MSARAVVTGIGVLCPNGLDTEQFWQATLNGHSGIGRLRRADAARVPAAVAGQITGFDDQRAIPGRLLPQTDRVTRLALAATDLALADAGVTPERHTDYDMGVVTSNATGGFEFTHTEINKLWTKGPEHVSVYESFAWFYAVNTGQISIRHGMRGPGAVIVAEQAGGLDAIGHARRTLRAGTKLSVTGGMESSFDPWGWVCHAAGDRLATCAEPARAFRPFAADAAGPVPGEGGAMLVIEDEQAARDRGAPRMYGVIAGYAATFDPDPGSSRPPGLERAARAAIADAGLQPADIDVVFADAAAVPSLDLVEAAALTSIFGSRGVPVTAPKTLVGRLCSGGGPVDVAAALLSIRDRLIPPTFHVNTIRDGCELDLVVDQPRPAAIRAALVLARGVGGFNSAMVVADFDSVDPAKVRAHRIGRN